MIRNVSLLIMIIIGIMKSNGIDINLSEQDLTTILNNLCLIAGGIGTIISLNKKGRVWVQKIKAWLEKNKVQNEPGN